jgi:stage V sporulation protein D (sporulation-specific penicillin-binding protein)
VIFVKLENPQGAYYGGAVAAPVTRATMEAALAARATPLDRALLLKSVRAEMVAPPAPPVGFASRTIDPPAPPDFGPGSAATGAEILRDVASGSSAAEGPVGDGEAAFESIPPGDVAGVPLPDVAGLPARVAARRLHGLGFRVRHEGTGPIEGTFPAAGTRLQPGDTVLLVVRMRTND